jgi:hypothetical protein
VRQDIVIPLTAILMRDDLAKLFGLSGDVLDTDVFDPAIPDELMDGLMPGEEAEWEIVAHIISCDSTADLAEALYEKKLELERQRSLSLYEGFNSHDPEIEPYRVGVIVYRRTRHR